jgi:hypothetical protein
MGLPLILENQNSNSPNTRTPRKFTIKTTKCQLHGDHDVNSDVNTLKAMKMTE